MSLGSVVARFARDGLPGGADEVEAVYAVLELLAELLEDFGRRVFALPRQFARDAV